MWGGGWLVQEVGIQFDEKHTLRNGFSTNSFSSSQVFCDYDRKVQVWGEGEFIGIAVENTCNL